MKQSICLLLLIIMSVTGALLVFTGHIDLIDRVMTSYFYMMIATLIVTLIGLLIKKRIHRKGGKPNGT